MRTVLNIPCVLQIDVADDFETEQGKLLKAAIVTRSINAVIGRSEGNPQLIWLNNQPITTEQFED